MRGEYEIRWGGGHGADYCPGEGAGDIYGNGYEEGEGMRDGEGYGRGAVFGSGVGWGHGGGYGDEDGYGGNILDDYEERVHER